MVHYDTILLKNRSHILQITIAIIIFICICPPISSTVLNQNHHDISPLDSTDQNTVHFHICSRIDARGGSKFFCFPGFILGSIPTLAYIGPCMIIHGNARIHVHRIDETFYPNHYLIIGFIGIITYYWNPHGGYYSINGLSLLTLIKN